VCGRASPERTRDNVNVATYGLLWACDRVFDGHKHLWVCVRVPRANSALAIDTECFDPEILRYSDQDVGVERSGPPLQIIKQQIA